MTTPANVTSFLKTHEKMMSQGFWALGMLMGTETGIVDTLVKLNGEPSTSHEVAETGNLKERYVREWLNCGVAFDFVSCNDQGLPYSKYPLPEARYNSMAEKAKLLFNKRTLIDGVASGFPEDVKDRLNRGAQLADVACGSGGTTEVWGAAFPNTKILGSDIDEEVIDKAISEAAAKQFSNLEYIVCDASKMPEDWTNRFDFVSISEALHDMARPDLCLQECRRILKPGGFMLLIDIFAHSNPAQNRGNSTVGKFYVASMFHCTPVSMYFPGGMGYGACWGKEMAIRVLSEAGFEVIGRGKNVVPNLMHIFAINKK